MELMSLSIQLFTLLSVQLFTMLCVWYLVVCQCAGVPDAGTSCDDATVSVPTGLSALTTIFKFL